MMGSIDFSVITPFYFMVLAWGCISGLLIELSVSLNIPQNTLWSQKEVSTDQKLPWLGLQTRKSKENSIYCWLEGVIWLEDFS